jgi:hypothetical protein
LLLILTNEIEGSRLGCFAIWQVCPSGLILAINTLKGPLVFASVARRSGAIRQLALGSFGG